MPALESLSQPVTVANERAQAWLRSAATQRMLAACWQAAAGDVVRASGRYGLFIHPQVESDLQFQSPNLHTAVYLHRNDAYLAGDVLCTESMLPFADDSFALVVLGWSFEFAHDPVGLATECARLLEPEGTLLVLGLNPWSPAHLRWLARGLHSWSPEGLRSLFARIGLEVVGCRYFGGFWSGGDVATFDSGNERAGMNSPLRSGFLLQARRHDPGLTPLRTTPARVVLGTGAQTG